MNELIEQPQTKDDDIVIRFVFVNGDTYEQPLPYSHLNGVEDLMAWFRDPKQGPAWTWQVPSCQKIHMLHRIHIMCIDIDGYIEPDEGKSRWYHRMVDSVRVWLMSRRVYGKNIKTKRYDDARGIFNQSRNGSL